MKAQYALDYIRNVLCRKYHFIPLDVPTRTKAQYFRTPENKVFGLIVGDLDSNGFKYGTADLLLEPVLLPDLVERCCQIVPKPYLCSTTEQPTKGVYLKYGQTRVRVEGELTLEVVLSWYASHVHHDSLC